MKKLMSILAICFMFALSFPATAPAPFCTTNDDCDDGIDCTIDECIDEERCENTPTDLCCDPKTQGYWHRQCLGLPAWLPGGKGPGIDPGRNGRGPKEPTEPGFADELMTCANAKLEDLGFFGVTTCEGMDADPQKDPCERATKQLTALILNVCSGKLGVDVSCNVDVSVEGCSATTAVELIDEAAALILSGDCKPAADCADMVNTGNGLVD